MYMWHQHYDYAVKPVYDFYIPENVSLHDGYMSLYRSFLNMENTGHRSEESPLITGCPLVGVSLEDMFYCTTVYNLLYKKYIYITITMV